MTLAAFLLTIILGAAAPQPTADGSVGHFSGQSSAQSAEQSSAPAATPATPSDNPTAQQTQGQTAPTTNPSTPPKPSTPSQTPAPTQTAHKRPHRKKKPASTDCVPAPAPSSSDPANAPSASSSGASTSGSPAPATAAAPTNCPPPKVIVRQGGTKEPSIELVGGAGGSQAAQLRDADNRILKSAEDNLAKLTGRTLDSNKQDIVDQIHQFIGEARTAIAAGELERARTLASKAQQLSQDLVQPPK